jgi:hypothetical protein
MDFDEMPQEEGLCVAIRGHSKHGKTHMANLVAGVERTVVADTHAANSTIETLRKIGQHKFRRVRDFDGLIRMTDDFIRDYDPPMAFVLDSGSDLVDMAQNKYKDTTGVQAFTFAWAEVWGYIRDWMNSITRAGYDLVLTSMMKRTYEQVAGSDGQTSGQWTGGWEPKEWKDLDYQLSVGIWLERGIRYDGKLLFDYRIFPAVKTKDGLVMSRWARLGECKPYIVGPFIRESIKEQIQRPWHGTLRDILNEYWLQLRQSELKSDIKFVKDIETFFKAHKIDLDKDWEPPVGKPYERPAIPTIELPTDDSTGPAKALKETEKAIKSDTKNGPGHGGETAENDGLSQEEDPGNNDEIPDSEPEPEEVPNESQTDDNDEDVWTI